MTAQQNDSDRIAETAFHIWLEEGQPHGRDQEHWFRAIDRLKAGAVAEEAPAPAKKARKAAPRASAAEGEAAPVKPRVRKGKAA